MASAEHQSNAEKWLSDNKSDFRLADSDEEGRLHFCIPDTSVSFIVTCPSEKEPWGVCSEDEQVLGQLQDVMEYLDSKDHLTIESVLRLISDKLKHLSSDTHQSSHRKRVVQNCEAVGGSDDELDEDFEDAEEGDDSENDGIDMGYYEDDPDVAEKEDQGTKEEDEMETNFFAAQGNPSSVQRLTKDLKNLMREGSKYGFTAEPRNNNLFKWDVQLRDIPEDTKLGKDLKLYSAKCKKEPVISMEMQFPGDYPFNPPFLRVIRPRFRFLTGHVTVGGSICMEMLTKSGWRPTNDIESILVQVRCEILSDPNASLDLTNPDRAYTEQEAREAFDRMVIRYGWNK